MAALDGFNARSLQGWCSRISVICDGLRGGKGLDQKVATEVVTTLQKIGEALVWAYQQKDLPRLGEDFSQAFLDYRLCDCFRELLREKIGIAKDTQNAIDNQILQTTLILFQSTPPGSSLLAYLQSGWFLNDVIAHRYNWQNDDLLNLWITFLKETSMKLTAENIILFYNPSNEDLPFPIFSEAARFYHFPGHQVRTAVQVISLAIFSKLREAELLEGAFFDDICREAKSYFTHVCCLLREFWIFLELGREHGRQNSRDVRGFHDMQCDVLVYLNDVLSCGIKEISDILTEKLFSFALFPILVRSAIGASSHTDQTAESEGILSGTTAWFLIHDVLSHVVKSEAIATTLAFTFLRPKIPAQVHQLCTSPAPCTPTAYATLKATWAPNVPQRFQRQVGDLTLDEQLYDVPPIRLVRLFSEPGVELAPNTVFDDFLSLLEKPEQTQNETIELALSVLCILLRATAAAGASTEDMLDDVHVVPALVKALCTLLSRWAPNLRWEAEHAALTALSEVAGAAGDKARARTLIKESITRTVLCPVAEELLRTCSEGDLAAGKSMVEAFLEQWRLHLSVGKEWGAAQTRLRRDVTTRYFLEGETHQDDSRLPDGSQSWSRKFRLLLQARKLCLDLDGKPQKEDADAPLMGDTELEERKMWKAGEAALLGKANRLLCTLQDPKGNTVEGVYLVPTESYFVLVQPDVHTPFWAVPVVSEPLKNVALPDPAADPGVPFAELPGPNQELRSLKLTVKDPESPLLGLTGSSSPFDSTGSGSPTRHRNGPPKVHSVELDLLFKDERRRRMASKFLGQSQQRLFQDMDARLQEFLSQLRAGKLA